MSKHVQTLLDDETFKDLKKEVLTQNTTLTKLVKSIIEIYLTKTKTKTKTQTERKQND